MNISDSEIQKIFKLSGLSIEKNEKYMNDLEKIVSLFNLLEDADIENVEMLHNIMEEYENNFRGDIKGGEVIIDDIFKNSKYHKYNYFSIPKVL